MLVQKNVELKIEQKKVLDELLQEQQDNEAFSETGRTKEAQKRVGPST